MFRANNRYRSMFANLHEIFAESKKLVPASIIMSERGRTGGREREERRESVCVRGVLHILNKLDMLLPVFLLKLVYGQNTQHLKTKKKLLLEYYRM